jgi:hypothetical protein
MFVLPILAVNERNISINLIGEAHPTLAYVSKQLFFGLVRSEFHQAKGFCRLISTALGPVHSRSPAFSTSFSVRSCSMPPVATCSRLCWPNFILSAAALCPVADSNQGRFFGFIWRGERQEDRVMERRRVKHETSLEERLAGHAHRLRDQAKTLPPGGEREGLIRRARQTEIASHINEWLTSPGLAPPD